MAVFQKETGVADGRGFAASDVDGYCANFYTWVTLAPASGGPEWYIVDDQSALATDPYIVVCDVAVPVVNDYNTGKSGGAPKFLKVGYLTSEAGYIRVQSYLWWNTTTHVGYGLWAGYRLATLDDGEYVYDFRGGDELMILQTRISTSWESCIVDDFVGDTNLLEAPTVIGTLQSALSGGSDATLDTGEGANFTVDNFYYIYDFDEHSWVDYVKVTAIASDVITIERAGGGSHYDYPAGAVIGSYPHRFYIQGDGYAASDLCQHDRKIPYCSYAYNTDHGEFHDQSGSIIGRTGFAFASEYITVCSPDDNGNYAVQRPGISEDISENSASSSDMNRGYGVCKNLYITSTNGIAQGMDGRTINAKDYIYFQGYSTYATLFPDTDSLS